MEKSARKAHTRDSLQALSKLGELVDGRYRMVSQPPIVVPAHDLAATYGLSPAEVDHAIRDQFRAYPDAVKMLNLLRYVDGDLGDDGTYKAMSDEIGAGQQVLYYMEVPAMRPMTHDRSLAGALKIRTCSMPPSATT